MPDESSASSEHALIQEITAPLATLPDEALVTASEVDFPVVLRGYDRIAVDAYVRKTTQLVAELQATRSPEAAVRRALARVGEEVSGILQRAHDTAGQITATSRSEAEDRLEAAREEALRITSVAERSVKELDAETDRIWAERLRIVEDARALARQLLGLAESAAERFPAEEPGEEEPGVQEPAPEPADTTEPTVAFPVPFGEPSTAGAGAGGPSAGETGEHTGAETPAGGRDPAPGWMTPPLAEGEEPVRDEERPASGEGSGHEAPGPGQP